MEIIDLIKAELKKQGLPENYANLITKLAKVEAEAEVQGAVTEFKTSEWPTIKADLDRIATASVQTAIGNYEKKHNLKEGKPITPPEDGKPPAGIPPATDEISKKMLEIIEQQKTQIDALTQTVTGIVQQQTQKQKLESARDLIKATKIPAQSQERWAAKINVSSETSVEDQIKALEAEYLEDHQIWVNTQVENGNYAPTALPGKDLTEADYLKVMNGETGADSTVAPLIKTSKN